MIRAQNADIYLNTLLEQEGVPLTDEASQPDVFITQQNGQLIFSSSGDALINSDSKTVRIKFIIPPNDSYFRNTGLVDINEKCRVFDFAHICSSAHSLPFNYYQNENAVLPFELCRLLKHRGKQPKQFYSRQGRCPYETVARSDRGGVRRILVGCLRSFLNRKQLPYIHLSYVPANCRSLFGFRVDTDYSQESIINECARIARDFDMAWTWFIMTAGIKDFSRLKNQLRGQDVQVHCHRHLVYPDIKRNIINYSIAIGKLELINTKPSGAAAPYGEWNEALGQALAELGFEYSSEFCYGYDDLPSRPIIQGKQIPVLQLPVHPISIGRLAWAKMNEDEMIAYYRNVIDMQVARGEPCFLYDHPDAILKHPRVIKEVIRYGLERCGSWMTMTQFYNWWRSRERVRYQCRLGNNRMELKVFNNAPDLELIIEYGDALARVPLRTGTYPFERLNWVPVEIIPAPADLVKIRHYSLRMRLQNIVRSTNRNLRKVKGLI
jgi:hypothetical protein